MISKAKRMSTGGDVKTPNKAKEIATPKKAKQTPAKGSKNTLNLSNIKVDSSATKNDKKRTHEEISKPTPKKLKSSNDSVSPNLQKSGLVGVYINFPKCSSQQLKKVVQKLVNEAADVADPKYIEVKLKSNAKENEKSLETLRNITIENRGLTLFGMNNSIDHQKRMVFVETKNATAEEIKEKYKAVSVKKNSNRRGTVFVLTFNSVADAEKASNLCVEIDGKECPPLTLSYSSKLSKKSKKPSKQTQPQNPKVSDDKQKKTKEVKSEVKKKVVVMEEDDDDNDEEEELEEEDSDEEEEIEDASDVDEDEDDDDDDDME